MWKGNSKHMRRGETPLFHRGTCRCGESNDAASCVNVRNVGLKEFVPLKSPAGVSRQSRCFQMKLVAVGLSAHGVNERLAVYLLAALQLCKNTIADRVDSDTRHLFRQPKRDA